MKKNIKNHIQFVKSPFRKEMGFFALLIFLLITTKGFSQSIHLDTISYSLTQKPSLLLKVDSKFSFVSNQLVSMRGVKAGANFNDVIKFGVGFSWMKNNFVFDHPNEVINNENYELHYSAISLFTDYVFHQNKQWQLVYNLETGGILASYKNKETKKADFKSKGMVLSITAISEHRFLKYVVLGIGGGYRAVFRNRTDVLEHFSAPIVIVRVKLDVVALAKLF